MKVCNTVKRKDDKLWSPSFIVYCYIIGMYLKRLHYNSVASDNTFDKTR